MCHTYNLQDIQRGVDLCSLWGSSVGSRQGFPGPEAQLTGLILIRSATGKHWHVLPCSVMWEFRAEHSEPGIWMQGQPPAFLFPWISGPSLTLLCEWIWA